MDSHLHKWIYLFFSFPNISVVCPTLLERVLRNDDFGSKKLQGIYKKFKTGCPQFGYTISVSSRAKDLDP